MTTKASLHSIEWYQKSRKLPMFTGTPVFYEAIMALSTIDLVFFTAGSAISCLTLTQQFPNMVDNYVLLSVGLFLHVGKLWPVQVVITKDEITVQTPWQGFCLFDTRRER
jgi:hypothetical protein